MKIAVIGDAARVQAIRRRLNESITVDHLVLKETDSADKYDVIIDLNGDERNETAAYFAAREGRLLILCAVKRSLAQMIHDSGIEVKCFVAGLNALPAFIENTRWEVSFSALKDRPAFEKWAHEMKIEFIPVQDRVGMITPRVICMIINEACYTLMEGTASANDIDKGMKLGANYPYGPFEWCDRIGIKDVYETLDAVRNDTNDQRYKICPLLKTHYLKGVSFYQGSAI